MATDPIQDLREKYRELKWDHGALSNRVVEIEEANPQQLRWEMARLNSKMDSILKAIITVGVGIVGAAVVFAFTVAQLH